MRLPEPEDIEPAAYLHALHDRLERVTEVIDRLTVDADMPLVASALSLHVAALAKVITDACENDAQGTNVVPHLFSSIDGLVYEVEAMLNRLEHH